MWKWMLSAGVLIVAIGGLYWIRREASLLDEELVYAYYQDEVNALRRLDGKALCRTMAEGYRIVDTNPTGKRGPVELDREAACRETQQAMQVLYKIAKPTKTAPDVKYTIESVTLSDDRRQALVKLRSTLKIGRWATIESSGTETLIRHMGEVRSLGGESVTTAKAR